MRARLVPLAVACVVALQSVACSNPETRKTERYEKGKALAASARYSEAILEFRNALKDDPNYADAHFAVAQAYERTDDSVNAYRSYQRAADLLPDNADVQLTVAKFLLRVRQFQDARTRAARVVQLDPRNAEAHIILGSALAGVKDVEGAIREVQEAIDLAPAGTDGYTGMGSLLLTQGRLAEAQAQFEKAVDVNPKSIDAQVALAAYHWSVGDTGQAEGILKKVLAIQPEHAVANRAMALLYIVTGRGVDAEPFLKVVGRTVGTPEAELPLADYYVRSGRAREARQILERAAASGNASAIVRLARLDYAENNRERAHARVDALLARQPSNAEALIAKGRWLLNDGKADEALRHAETATQGDPGSAAGYLLLGDVHAALGGPADAATAYTTVLRLNPRAAAAHTALSRINLAKGNAETSVEFARGALLNQPGNDEARVLLVKGLLQRRELKRAEEEIAVLLERRPDDPTVHALNGTLKMRRGDRAAARHEFERALGRDPASVEALTGLTALDAGEGQIGRARERLARALAQDGRNVPILMLAARADLQAGDFASGERRTRSVIDLDPSHVKAYELLGSTYIRQAKLPAALAEFELVVQREPRSIGALTVVGMLHEALRQPHEAEKTYQKALQLDPRAAVAGNNLAYMLAERGDNLKYALVLAREAASVVKDDPVVLDTLGWVYLKNEQPVQAIAELSKAVRLAPENPVYHFHLGLAYATAHDPANARASLQRALQLNPQFAGANEARDRLRTLTN